MTIRIERTLWLAVAVLAAAVCLAVAAWPPAAPIAGGSWQVPVGGIMAGLVIGSALRSVLSFDSATGSGDDSSGRTPRPVLVVVEPPADTADDTGRHGGQRHVRDAHRRVADRRRGARKVPGGGQIAHIRLVGNRDGAPR
jgi:hypothetical protein